jgi:hypothetical protein
VDVIPSPIKEPLIPIVFKEQEPVVKQMDVDPRAEEPNPTKNMGLGAPQ